MKRAWVAVLVMSACGGGRCGGSSSRREPSRSTSAAQSTGGCAGGGAAPVVQQRQDGEVARRPVIEWAAVPAWPPLGPEASLVIEVADADGDLEHLDVDFANSLTWSIQGSEWTLTVTGAELGEGFGTLWVGVTDGGGRWAERWIEPVLVDLSPPVVDAGPTIVRGDGEGSNGALWVWASDAWVLAGIQVEFLGATIEEVLPAAYPSTVGDAWDETVIMIPGSELPAGSGEVLVKVFDAAGNAIQRTFDLMVDAWPPTVAIAAPSAGAILSGAFAVDLTAADVDGSPVWIELSLGGTVVATAAGPSARVSINALDFTPGDLELSAVAVDVAGNRSEPAAIGITIE